MKTIISRVRGLVVAALICILAWQATANPAGGVVANGAANITSAGRLLTVSQTSSRAIINWNSFSIANGESTIFQFNSAAGANSAVLNRVSGAYASSIAGILRSTIGVGGPVGGTVLIFNPNGIMFTPTAQVNVGSLVASSLNLADDRQFLNNQTLTLSGSSTAGVQNQGSIQAVNDVYLIAHTVKNSGDITAGGRAGLAAGTTVTLAQSGAERLTVEAGTAGTGAATGVDNSAAGQINAVTAELKAAGGNIYALAINNGGVVRANTFTREGGRIFLRASGGNIQNSGTLAANGADGSGGKVVVDGGHNAANASTVTSSGKIEARGDGADGKGGTVHLLGDHVGLMDNASVDASGQAGGGTVLVGGGYRGAESSVQNAQATFVSPGASITADALSRGNGGNVVVWSDTATRFYGVVSARGGGQSGNGGSVEVSGHSLDFRGNVSTLAPHGRAGWLLLDPTDLTIDNGTDQNVTTSSPFGPAGTAPFTSELTWTTIKNALSGGNVLVTTVGSPVNVGQNGDITVAAGNMDLGGPGDLASGNQLTLQAARSLSLGASIVNSGSGTLVLEAQGANGGVAISQTAGILQVNMLTITAPSGSVTLDQANQVGVLRVTSAGGTVQFTDAADLDVQGISANGQDVTLSGAGNIAVNQNVTANSFNLHSGTDGSGNISFGPGPVHVNADIQSYQAGDGLGGGGTVATADLLSNGPQFAGAGGGATTPTSFTYEQDGAIADAAIPLAIQFGGGAAPGTYVIRSDDSTISITLPGTAANLSGSALTLGSAAGTTIGADLSLASLTLDGAANVNNDVTTTADQTYNGAVTLGGAGAVRTLAGANVNLASTVTGAGKSLTVNSPGTTTFGGAVSGVTALTTDNQSGAGEKTVVNGTVGATSVVLNDTANLNNDVTTTGDQTYNGAVTLGGAGAVRTLAGANVNLASTVTGAGKSLTVNSPGTTTFGGGVSGVNALTTDSQSGVGEKTVVNGTVGATTVVLNDAASLNNDLTTTGDQTYNGAVTLGGAGAVRTLAGANVNLASTVTGAGKSLTVNSPGTTTFGGGVSGVNALTTDNQSGAGEKTVVNGTVGATSVVFSDAANVNNDVTTTADQTYNGAVTLGGAGAVRTLAGANVNLASTVTGAGKSLTVNSPGTTTFGGAVNGVNALTTDNQSGAGEKTVVNGTVGATTVVLNDAANLNNDLTTTGDQTYNGAVTLGGAGAVRTLAGANVNLASTVTGAGKSLTVNSPGTTTFGGGVSGVNALTTDNQSGAGEKTVVNGTVGATSVVLNDAANLNNDVTTTGNQTYNGGVTTSAGRALSGSTVIFNNRLSAGGDSTVTVLTVNGNLEFGSASTLFVTLNGKTGGTFDQITINGAGSTLKINAGAALSGSAGFSFAVPDSVTVINSSPGATLSGAGTFGASTAISGQNFTIDHASGVNNVTLTRAATSWTWLGGINNNWGTDGNWNLPNNPGNGDSVLFTTTAGSLTPFNNLFSLQLNQINFSGSSLFTLSGNGVTLLSGGGIFNNSSFKQTINLPITLAAGSQTFSSVGGQLAFGGLGTIVGGSALTLNGGNTITFGAPVGAGLGNELASLTANAPLVIKGGSVTSSGSQNYVGQVTLGADAALNTSSSLGTLTLNVVDGGNNSLTLNNSGSGTLNGAVTSVNQLNVTGSGNLLVNNSVGAVQVFDLESTEFGPGSSVTTSGGGQTYNGLLTMDVGAALQDTGFGFMSLGGVGLNASGGGVSISTSGGIGISSLFGNGTITLSGNNKTIGSSLSSSLNLIATGGSTTYGSAPNDGSAIFNENHSVALDEKHLDATFNGLATFDGGSMTTLGGGQTYNGNVFLNQNATLADTLAGAIAFNGQVNGAHALNVNTFGTTTFGGMIGNATPLLSLTTDGGPGLTTLNAAAFIVGAATFGDSVKLNNATLTAGSAVFNGATELNVNGTAVSTAAGGAGGAGQIYNGAVTLSQNTTLADTANGSVAFNAVVNGNKTLEVDTGGATTFNALVGNATALAALTTDGGAGLTTINAATRVSGAATFGDPVKMNALLTAGSAVFNGATELNVAGTAVSTAAGGAGGAGQIYNGAVTLSQNTTLADTANGSVTFNAVVNGAKTLEVDTGGATTFNALVGNATALAALTTDGGAGLTTINAATRVSGAATFGDPVKMSAPLTAGSAVFNGATELNVAGTAVSTAAGGAGGAGQIYNGAVTLSQNTTLVDTANGSVTFNAVLNGAKTLEVDTGGATTFNALVGNAAALAALTTDGGAGLTTINAATRVSGAATFSDPVKMSALLTAGSAVFNGATELNVAGTAVSTAAGGAGGAGQIYNGAVTLSQNTTLADSANGSVTFNAVVDGARTLEVDTGGATTFNALVGNAAALAALTTDGGAGSTTINAATRVSGAATFGDSVKVNALLTAGSAVFNGATELNVAGTAVSTAAGGAGGAGQIYNGAVTLSQNTTLADAANGAITFNGEVNGDAANNRTLVVNSGGVTTFGGNVGNTAKLLSLTTDNQSGAGEKTVISGALVNATTVDFADDVTVGGNVAVNGTTVSFEKTVNDAAANTHTLAVNADGVTTFGGNVGNTAKLLALSTDNQNGAGEKTVISGALVSATTVAFADDVTVGNNLAVNGTTVSFEKTVNDAAANTHTLAVNANGVTTFGGNVGNTAKLLSLTTDNQNGAGERTLINGALVNATTLDFADDVTIGNNVAVNATTVSFGKTVNDAAANTHTLAVNADGVTTFGGSVGNAARLLSLTTDNQSGAGEKTVVSGALVNATTVDFQDDVTVGNNVAVNGTTVSFEKTVNDAAANTHTLAVNANGVTTFGGNVGNTAKLLALTTDNQNGAGEKTVVNGTLVNATTVDFADDVTVGNDLTVNGTTVSFGKTVNDAAANTHTLAVNANGVTTFGGSVGNTAKLLSLTTDNQNGAGEKTAVNGALVNATTVDFQDDVTVGGNVAVNGTTVSFEKTVNDAAANTHTLAVNADGVTTFGGSVGNTAKLLSLTTDNQSGAGEKTVVNGALVSATTVDFADDVTVGNDLAVSGTTVSFEKTVNDAAVNTHTLAVNANGVTTFGGSVGNTAKLLSLTTDSQSGAGERTVVNGTLVNATTVDFADDVTVGNDVAVNGTTVSFEKSVNDAVANTHTLAVNANGVTTFGGNVGNTAKLLSLTTDNQNGVGEMTVVRGPSVNATTVDFADDVMVADDVVVNGTTVRFEKTVNDAAANTHTLTVNAGGVTTFGGSVGNAAKLLALTTDNQSGAGEKTLVNGTLVNATIVDFQDDVTLGNDVAVNGTTVSFEKTVNDSAANTHTLAVNADGVTTFGGSVGDTAKLRALTTDNPGMTLVNGTLVKATTVDFADDVTVGNNVAVNGTTVSFEKTVNDSSANTHTLTVNANGVTTFGGSVGNTAQLGALTTDNPGVTVVNGAVMAGSVTLNDAVNLNNDVTTTGDQTYNGAVTLGGAGAIRTLAGANVNLAGTVAGGGKNLTVNSPGTTTFGGNVSGISALTTDNQSGAGEKTVINGAVNAGTVTLNDAAILNNTVTTTGNQTYNGAANVNALVSAASAVFNGGTVLNALGTAVSTTGGGQSYNGAVTLNRDTTLADSGAGTIVFGNTIDGASSLTVNTSGETRFAGLVGNSTALAGLTTDAGGTTSFRMDAGLAGVNNGVNNGGVNVAGLVTINDPVTFNVANSSSAGHPSVLTSGSAGGQIYNARLTLGLNTVLADKSGHDITFNSTIDGAHALAVNTLGNEVFNGLIGNAIALTSLITDDQSSGTTSAEQTGGEARFNMDAGTAGVGKGGINVNGSITINDRAVFNIANSSSSGHPSVITTGTQTYNGGITLLSPTVLQSGVNPGITISGSAQNPQNVTLTTISAGFGINVTVISSDNDQRILSTILPKEKKGQPKGSKSEADKITEEIVAMVPVERSASTASTQTPQ